MTNARHYRTLDVRGAVASFLLVASAFFAGWSPSAAQGRQPPMVYVEPVYEARFATYIEALGTLQPNERVELTVNVADRVTSLYFEDGERVTKGQTLLSLAQAEQRARVEGAEATLREAQNFVERLRPLVADGGVAGAQFEEAKRNVEVARAELTTLQVQQAERLLVAPFAGVLGFRRVSEGAYVRPGDVVATLIDDSRMRLEFAVPARFLADLAPGASIRARTNAYPGEIFEGVVASIDNAIDPATHSVRIRAELPNPDGRLRAGLFMEVTVEAAPRMGLAIPEQAIEPAGAQSFVFVVQENEGRIIANRREIQVGQRSNGEVEVIAGLGLGERIIVEGGIRARDGAPIRIGDPASLSLSPPDVAQRPPRPGGSALP
ncbi:MAG: efflux RND transporter periplasmic adaptor subunit [Pseudomonadota bacterium]